MAFWSVFLVAALSRLKTEPMVSFHQWPMWPTWKNLVQQVIRIPAPMSRNRPIRTHTKSLITLLTSASLLKKFSIFSSLLRKNEGGSRCHAIRKKQRPLTGQVSFVLLPERLARGRFAPSAPNSMGFSKVLSAYSPHPDGGHLRALLLRLQMQFPVSVTQKYSVVHILATFVFARKDYFPFLNFL